MDKDGKFLLHLKAERKLPHTWKWEDLIGKFQADRYGGQYGKIMSLESELNRYEQELFDRYNGEADCETYNPDAYYGRLLDEEMTENQVEK